MTCLLPLPHPLGPRLGLCQCSQRYQHHLLHHLLQVCVWEWVWVCMSCRFVHRTTLPTTGYQPPPAPPVAQPTPVPQFPLPPELNMDSSGSPAIARHHPPPVVGVSTPPVVRREEPPPPFPPGKKLLTTNCRVSPKVVTDSD